MKWALLALAACGGLPPAPVPISHATALDVGIVDVVIVGDATYAFQLERVVIRRGNAIVATSPVPNTIRGDAATWRLGTSIPALDGEGRWAVGIDSEAHLWRIRLDGELESLGARFGAPEPGGNHIWKIRSAGHTIALQIDDDLAYTRDGVHLVRTSLREEALGQRVGTLVRYDFAVASDRIAIARRSGLEVWDLTHGTRTAYPVHTRAEGEGFQYGEPAVAFLDADTPNSRLVVHAVDGVYVEHDGKLQPLGLTAVNSLAVAGSRLWAVANRQLYTFSGHGLHATDARVETPGFLFATADGAAWWANGHRGELKGARVEHYELDQTHPDPAWTAHVQPVFERVCAHCHLPGGSADVDLSTAAAWTSEHDEIVRRVIATRTMPPAGTTLTDADRDALAAWLHAR